MAEDSEPQLLKHIFFIV